jgi:hypothetical protein
MIADRQPETSGTRSTVSRRVAAPNGRGPGKPRMRKRPRRWSCGTSGSGPRLQPFDGEERDRERTSGSARGCETPPEWTRRGRAERETREWFCFVLLKGARARVTPREYCCAALRQFRCPAPLKKGFAERRRNGITASCGSQAEPRRHDGFARPSRRGIRVVNNFRTRNGRHSVN